MNGIGASDWLFGIAAGGSVCVCTYKRGDLGSVSGTASILQCPHGEQGRACVCVSRIGICIAVLLLRRPDYYWIYGELISPFSRYCNIVIANIYDWCLGEIWFK